MRVECLPASYIINAAQNTSILSARSFPKVNEGRSLTVIGAEGIRARAVRSIVCWRKMTCPFQITVRKCWFLSEKLRVAYLNCGGQNAPKNADCLGEGAAELCQV